MVLSIHVRRSDSAKPDVSRDVNRLIKRELHGLSNAEDEKRLQPTNVKPFVGKYVSNLKLPR